MTDPAPPAVTTESAPEPKTVQTLNYGWLGGKERATNESTGLVLMGARLYNKVTGLFTSVDPVPGGNTTAYTYPQDPINKLDLDGLKAWYKKWQNWAKIGAFGACLVVSAGACMAIGLGVAFATNVKRIRRDRRGLNVKFNARQFGIDAGLAMIGGGIGRSVSGAWKGSALARNVVRGRRVINWRMTGRNVARNAYYSTPFTVAGAYIQPRRR